MFPWLWKLRVWDVGIVLAMPCLWFFSPEQIPLSSRVAGTGGLIALLGMFITARQVRRIGVLAWISYKVFSRFEGFSHEKMNDLEERIDDEIHAQVFGPLLIGLGTVINGFSGYAVLWQ